tara:strand:- start:171 stop:275 length:105 start_codon:yes stop_codon:yes gene_type:complete
LKVSDRKVINEERKRERRERERKVFESDYVFDTD